MGGAGSVTMGRYPLETSMDLVPTTGGQGLLTREMLDNLARKNMSPEKKRSVREYSLTRVTKNNELPAKAVTLLNKIGIATTDDVSYNEQKSKLVTHIFDCLGVLQNLVNDADLDYNPELETVSVCERDTKAMGTLLHEMVNQFIRYNTSLI
jgi:hypothetical protein